MRLPEQRIHCVSAPFHLRITQLSLLRFPMKWKSMGTQFISLKSMSDLRNKQSRHEGSTDDEHELDTLQYYSNRVTKGMMERRMIIPKPHQTRSKNVISNFCSPVLGIGKVKSRSLPLTAQTRSPVVTIYTSNLSDTWILAT